MISVAGGKTDGDIVFKNLSANQAGDNCVVSVQMILDDLHVKPNHQIFVTPYIESGDGQKQVQMPSVVFSGRNMHYVYLRSGKTKATGKTRYNILKEMLRKGGSETFDYSATTPMQPWMRQNDSRLVLAIDTCGCGRAQGSSADTNTPLALNPAGRMIAMPYPTVMPDSGKLVAHNGKARVQFEVNHIELHEQPYVCKSGQRIDNRAELKVIDDSIRYALSDPNVEIARLVICGYASPETPYEHNNYLATNRSRALTEYIEKKHSLPHERCVYTAVTENWGEFREQVLEAKDITEQQRKDLLELIDRPAQSPAEYDAKEAELKTSPKFAKLYAQKILPLWFPKLRATTFTITTHLKPMTSIQLREVLATKPELMSINEIYRVANTYEHGSAEWKNAMEVALKYYPDDAVANCNAAAMAIEAGNYDGAEKLLKKAGDSDEANVLRGIVETNRGDYAKARAYFLKAKDVLEAQRNLNLIK